MGSRAAAGAGEAASDAMYGAPTPPELREYAPDEPPPAPPVAATGPPRRAPPSPDDQCSVAGDPVKTPLRAPRPCCCCAAAAGGLAYAGAEPRGRCGCGDSPSPASAAGPLADTAWKRSCFHESAPSSTGSYRRPRPRGPERGAGTGAPAAREGADVGCVGDSTTASMCAPPGAAPSRRPSSSSTSGPPAKRSSW